MLIRSTGEVTDGIYLINVGSTCHYLIQADGFYLVDTSASCKFDSLLQKLSQIGVRPEDINGVFITHLDADRNGALPRIRKEFPHIQIFASSKVEAATKTESFVKELYEEDLLLTENSQHKNTEAQLSLEEFTEALSIDHIIRDGDILELGHRITARAIYTPGHTDHSLSYLITPQQFLIVDESYGYFKVNEFSASGADYSIEQSLQTLEKTLKLQLRGLCMPHIGVLTGTLVRKHLEGMIENSKGMVEECRQGLVEEMTLDDIAEAVKESFYTPKDSYDSVSNRQLQRSFQCVWYQVNLQLTNEEVEQDDRYRSFG